VYNIHVKRTTDHTTTAHNYNELYDCQWDQMALTNNTLYTPGFKFL